MKSNSDFPGQMSIFDFLRPDFYGERDEIVRLHIETQFEMQIALVKCSCGCDPKPMFKSDKDYFIECHNCSCRTGMYRHLYEAKQAWNRGLVSQKAIPVDIKGICDDAYCPKCNCCLDEYKYLDQDCPYCHTRLDWAPWHRKNDDWWLNRQRKE